MSFITPREFVRCKQKCGVLIKTPAEDLIARKIFYYAGLKTWRAGENYLERSFWKVNKERTYLTNKGTYGNIDKLPEHEEALGESIPIFSLDELLGYFWFADEFIEEEGKEGAEKEVSA